MPKKNLEQHRKEQESQQAKSTETAKARKDFLDATSVKASEARKVAESVGAKTVTETIEIAWTKIMVLVKNAAMAGQCVAQVPAGHMVHPDVKAGIVKKLDAGGFKHELDHGIGYIYW